MNRALLEEESESELEFVQQPVPKSASKDSIKKKPATLPGNGTLSNKGDLKRIEKHARRKRKAEIESSSESESTSESDFGSTSEEEKTAQPKKKIQFKLNENKSEIEMLKETTLDVKNKRTGVIKRGADPFDSNKLPLKEDGTLYTSEGVLDGNGQVAISMAEAENRDIGERYSYLWRQQYEARRAMLEKSKDHQFLTNLAGKTNTSFDSLVQEEDRNSVFRRQRLQSQIQSQITVDRKGLYFILGEKKKKWDSIKVDLLRTKMGAFVDILNKNPEIDIETFGIIANNWQKVVKNYIFYSMKLMVDKIFELEDKEIDILTDSESTNISILENEMIEEKNEEKRANYLKQIYFIKGIEAIIYSFTEGKLGVAAYDKMTFLKAADKLLGFSGTLSYNAFREKLANTRINFEGDLEELPPESVNLRRYVSLEKNNKWDSTDPNFDSRDIEDLMWTEYRDSINNIEDNRYLFFLYNNGSIETRKKFIYVVVDVNNNTEVLRQFVKNDDIKNIIDGELFEEFDDNEKKFISPLFIASTLFLKDRKTKLAFLKSEEKRVLEEIEQLQTRLTNLELGKVEIERQPELPYEHSLAWLNNPINSGILRPHPIVISGISAAFTSLCQRVPWVTSNRTNKPIDVELFQHDTYMMDSFASLVATEMALVANAYPKKYLQLGLRQFSKEDRIKILMNIKNNFEPIYDKKNPPTITGFKMLSYDERVKKNQTKRNNSTSTSWLN